MFIRHGRSPANGTRLSSCNGIYYVSTSEISCRKRKSQSGEQLGVRIPKAVAEEARLQEGDAILIEVSKGHVELRPAERIPTLEKLVRRSLRKTVTRQPTGADVGKEIVEW